MAVPRPSERSSAAADRDFHTADREISAAQQAEAAADRMRGEAFDHQINAIRGKINSVWQGTQERASDTIDSAGRAWNNAWSDAYHGAIRATLPIEQSLARAYEQERQNQIREQQQHQVSGRPAAPAAPENRPATPAQPAPEAHRAPATPGQPAPEAQSSPHGHQGRHTNQNNTGDHAGSESERVYHVKRGENYSILAHRFEQTLHPGHDTRAAEARIVRQLLRDNGRILRAGQDIRVSEQAQ